MIKLITSAVDNIFTELLEAEHTGYAGVTTLAFFENQTDEYCDINETALTENQVNAAYDPKNAH